MSRDLLLYTAQGSVGLASPRPVGKSFAWHIDARRIGVRTDATGSLVLNDLSGRVVVRVDGTGDLGVDAGALPRRVLLARFDGEGVHEVRVISPAASISR